tara:strand:- start:262 stop:492 length:231 start_codon:yes stop_codon:yes gene_type:complete
MKPQDDDHQGLPQSLMDKIYDSTGSVSGGNRGFLLLYVDKNGCPSMTTKTENPCVEMALSKLIELAISKKDGDSSI